ncbi:MAG: hypothetical protein HRU25_13150 [Psychrobium sp.]|nr:hypothetical protein [Psychrobium sp.]
MLAKTLSLLIFIPILSFADEVTCTIEIEDINASSKGTGKVTSKVTESFILKPFPNALTDMQQINFKLPGNQYLCTLAFLDLKKGSSLSCQNKYSYVQSDQSGFKVDRSENNLTFRNSDSHFSLNALCANKA